MHILFLTDNFPPEVNAPASRTYEHCREWVKAGHRVTVVTCVPNFPKGKVFEGFRNRLWQRQNMDGIDVVRVWSYVTANEGFLRRVLDYLSFMVSAIVASPRIRHVDVIVGTSPQFFTACAAYVISLLKRRPWVFELRDLWPETIKAVGAMRDSLAIRMLERLELFLYRRATAIVSVTESFKKVLVARGIDPGKIHVVTNGVDLSHFAERPKDAELIRTYGLEGKFVAGYIGTHGMCHALETVVEAADRMRGKDVVFISLGDGARKQFLRDLAAQKGLDNIIFIDSVGKADVARFWSILDVSIIHLQRSELFTTVIPSKLFECMGMGIPVLHGVGGESARIVQDCDVGVTFTPEDVDGLVHQLESLQRDPNRMARYRANCIASARLFDRSFLANRMLVILSQVACSRPTPTRAWSNARDGSMSVLILNQGFWPDLVATAQHSFDLAQHLVRGGDRVSVVSSRSMYGKSGAVLPKYESVDGIHVHRVSSNLFGKSGIAGRMFDFLSFHLACLFRVLRLPRHDAVVCLTTPPFIGFVGILLRWLKGTRFVFWTMDLYPDLPLQARLLSRGSLLHRLLDWMDRFCLARADAVVVLGRCMLNRIDGKGCREGRTELISPWADTGAIMPSSPVRTPHGQGPSDRLRSEWGIGDRYVIEYSGNYAIGHDTRTVTEAMNCLKDDDAIRWLFVGGGVKRPSVERFAASKQLGNVIFRPYEKRNVLSDLLGVGDVHLVLLDDGFEGIILPSKFYAILAAGRPTIFIGPAACEVAQVIQETGCGMIVANGDSAGLVAAIQSLRAAPEMAREMGRKGRQVAEERFSMKASCAAMQELLHRIVGAVRPDVDERSVV
jgi:glycosyltransferase involved in cell wall biosynthesis